ncbi:hypothetical protein B0H63DRAFT_63742 [Podospora didyma]|uniref:Zn(2)-C6 fungal-type domain-containing protein n=1 Tax=Podospora didyma TaxID=330526 RepID=A0AAE0P7Z7_9PEZI|nr:hypothetical protein B0H63DRAFT_63742 [Podospora didyma]
MPFCGKPSTACLPCRQKRRRCDKLQPGCTQCVRAMVACPGYRDMSTVYFRDQTKEVAKKVEEAKARSSRTRPPTPPRQTDLIKLALPTPVHQVATNYFLAFYAPATAFSYLSTSPRGREDIPNSVLVATSLALFSREANQPSLIDQARQHYITAIAETNAALASPSLAIRDATLSSVLLLALFEATLFRGRSSPTSWTAHTLGATALLALRGEQQFQTPLGRALFRHASASISTSCMQHNKPVPPEIIRLGHQLAKTDCPEAPLDLSIRLLPILDDMSELLAWSDNGRRGPPADFLASVRKLDSFLVDLMDTQNKVCPFKLTDRSHWYPSYRTARFWSISRMLRILYNLWMANIAPAVAATLPVVEVDGPSSSSGGATEAFVAVLTDTATRNVDTMATDVLDSVAYFVDSSVHDSVPLVARCLIWPLAHIAICPIARYMVRDEARRQLGVLGRDFGIVQATEALCMVEEKRSMEDWLHLCFLS